MAPSNLSQVFVANTATTPGLVAGAFSQTAASGLAANSKFGIWDINAGAYLTGASTTTSLMSVAGKINSSLKNIQITQTMLSGNCIATPIIDAVAVKRVAITKYQPTKLHQVKIDLTGYSGTTTDAINDGIMFRFALRNAPTSYISYTNPSDTTLDLSATSSAINSVTASSTLYPFPLVGNFSAGRMIFNLEVTESQLIAAGGDTIANVQTGFVANFNANNLLKKLFIVDTTKTANAIIVTARHAGVVFDMTIQSGESHITSADVTVDQAADTGVGNYWQVIGEEKSMRAKYGNFNRMYFPMNFPEFASAAVNYDAVDIAYTHGHPASTGIARAAELNNVRIYVPTAVAASTNIDGILANTDADVIAAFAASAGVTTEWWF